MQLQILGFLLLFIPIGLYFQNNLTIKITRDEKVKTYKLISVAFVYLILLIILSVVSIVLTQSTAVKTLNNQLSSINFIKGVVESRCFDQYALGGYYPKPVDKDRLPGAPVTEVVDVNKKYLIDQLIDQDTASKSRLQYMIVTQICIIIIIVLSLIYLAVSLNALHLIKNFKMINQIQDPISEKELVDKTLTLADVNKKVAVEKQTQLDTVIAKRLQHKERLWVQEEQKKIHEKIIKGNAKEVQFEDELLEFKDNLSSGGLSSRSAVSNIHGRKKQTKYEKKMQEVSDDLSPNELAKKKKKSRRK